MAMAYADLRAYQERLDELCGLDWSVEYQPWGDRRIIARLTIHGVTRASTGEMDAQDEKNNMGGTVAEAQAMKRAAAQFGLGRYLYDLPSVWVAYDSQARKISKAGQDELDNRYRTWYAKTVAKQAAPVSRQVDTSTGEIMDREVDFGMGAPDNPPEDDEPSEVEKKIIDSWRSRTEAEMWSVGMGACASEFEAKNSLNKSINAHGGKVTADNFKKIYLHFLRRQNEKLALQEAQPELVAA